MISLFEDNIPLLIPRQFLVVTSDSRSNCSTSSYVGVEPLKVKKHQAIEALNRLRPLMAHRQSEAVAELMRGEEGEFFMDKMVELAQLVDSMPATYSQRNESDPIAYLHYFFGGSDWYIAEKDMDGEVDQAWGFACLNGDMMNAEYGYISIAELVALKLQFGVTVDLDFHFKPTRMSLVQQGLKAKNGY
ncbi:MAG: DUF2958 domain-containing protein [Thiobacillus sp.]